MKTLILMRHAKSSWNDAGLSDFERILNKRGRQDAPIMGQQLAKRALKIDKIICSSAQRTLETARAVAKELDYSSQIQTDIKIYAASTQSLFYIAQSLNDAWQTVLLIGHNPSMHWLSEQLSPNTIHEMPTAKMIGFQCPIEHWADLQTGQNQLIFEDYPRLHRE